MTHKSSHCIQIQNWTVAFIAIQWEMHFEIVRCLDSLTTLELRLKLPLLFLMLVE
jgi:hypothetical protein